jgi:hypothetical protein
VIFQEGIRVHSLALEMLARDGFAAIWVLHLSAARAYREGRKAAATATIEIADAAEREWLRRENRPAPIPRVAPIGQAFIPVDRDTVIALIIPLAVFVLLIVLLRK